MRIEELWLALEKEAAATSDSSWLIRHATPAPGQQLLVAVEPGTLRRAILLPVQQNMLPARSRWPECRGLEVLPVSVGGTPHLAVYLRDPDSADVFAALADDVAPRIAAVTSPDDAVVALFDRLRRWQRFLTATHAGLDVEEERGLWGELYVLRSHLLRPLGPRRAVSSWKSPSAAHQDFQLPVGAIEVKTTAAKQPSCVRVTSERQLDTTGVGSLFLHVVVVDEREVDAAMLAQGDSLTAMILALRTILRGDGGLVSLFNDRLLDAGYLDAHASRYESRRRTVRAEHTFQVREGFPRLTESLLPVGIGTVSYDLTLSSCTSFAVSIEGMVSTLNRDPDEREGHS